MTTSEFRKAIRLAMLAITIAVAAVSYIALPTTASAYVSDSLPSCFDYYGGGYTAGDPAFCTYGNGDVDQCVLRIDGCTNVATSPDKTAEAAGPVGTAAADLLPDASDPTILAGAPPTPLDDAVGEQLGFEPDVLSSSFAGTAPTDGPIPELPGPQRMAWIWGTDDPQTAEAVQTGRLSVNDAAVRSTGRGFSFYICGLTFRRRVARVGAVAHIYNYGARFGGPTVKLPGIAKPYTFAACSGTVFMAVQGRLVRANDIYSVLDTAGRLPADGLQASSNLYSGATKTYQSRVNVRVQGNVRIKAPIGIDPTKFVVGVTYDPATTDAKGNRCSVVSEFERSCVAYSNPYN